MAQGWRVLDATSFSGTLSAKRGSLLLKERQDSEGTHVVPAEEVAVVIIGVRTSVTSAALQRLAKHDIALLSADWRGVPVAGMYPWADHGRVAARHIAQAQLSLPRKKNAWMQITRAKVAGQAATLRVVDAAAADRLVKFVGQVRSGDPTNVEGKAARFYWSRLFRDVDKQFHRIPEGSDSTNSLLNYGYAVLRGYGIRAVLGAGLSPPIGLFHRGRSNYFNLVDDLIEPFRPAIDATVLNIGSESTLDDPAVKRRIVASASQTFTSDGLRIPSVLVELAQSLGRYIEGDLNRLDVPTWTGIVQSSSSAAHSEGTGQPDDAVEGEWNSRW